MMEGVNAKCSELLEQERRKLSRMIAEGEADSSILKQSKKLDKLILEFIKSNTESET